jgi:hypothetical protein
MTQQPEVMIGHAMDCFDQEGNLTDVVTKEFIIKVSKMSSRESLRKK